MAIKIQKEEVREVQVQRPERVKLTAEETRRRMEEFTEKRKEKLIAAVRKDQN